MAIAESKLINIRLHRMFIVQRLAESIAENLRRRFNYEVSEYYKICIEFLTEVGLDRQYVRDLMKDVITDGYELHFEYKRTGEYTYHNGSGAHPEALIAKEAQDLAILLGYIIAEGHYKEKTRV